MEDQTSQLLELQDVLFGYANDFLQTLPSLLLGVLVLVLFVAFAGLAKKLATRAAERLTDDPSLQSLFGQVTRVVFLAVGVFASAAVIFPGLSAGHLVSVLGLSSVAIGFAFKDIFQNFLAGILILSQRDDGEPRSHVTDGALAQPVFGIDVESWSPGTAVTFADTVFG
ncbi:MAG: hypothetical protein ACOC9J_02055, partial [Persicimonas sp.]